MTRNRGCTGDFDDAKLLERHLATRTQKGGVTTVIKAPSLRPEKAAPKREEQPGYEQLLLVEPEPPAFHQFDL